MNPAPGPLGGSDLETVDDLRAEAEQAQARLDAVADTLTELDGWAGCLPARLEAAPFTLHHLPEVLDQLGALSRALPYLDDAMAVAEDLIEHAEAAVQLGEEAARLGATGTVEAFGGGRSALDAVTGRLADRPRRGRGVDTSALTLTTGPVWSPDQAEAAAAALRGYRGATWREIHAWTRAQATGDQTVPAVITRRETLDGPATQIPIPAVVDLVDSVMDAAPLAAPVLLWRGVDGRHALGRLWSPDDLTGVTWTEASYQSASASRQVAETFVNGADTALLLRLHVPAGTGAIQLSSWPTRNRHTLEAELLLQRGLHMTATADHTQPWGNPEDGYTHRILDIHVTRQP